MKKNGKNLLISAIAIMIIVQLTTLSFATTITVNQTDEELIQYNKNLEKEAKENLEKLQNNEIQTSKEVELNDSLKSNTNGALTTSVGDSTGQEDESDEDDDVVWTDFSKAQVSFKFDSNTSIIMNISNVKLTDKHVLTAYIGTDPNNLSKQNKDGEFPFYTLTNETDKIQGQVPNQCMALNKEYYYSLEEVSYIPSEHRKVVLTGKIERPELPPVGSRIDVYMYAKGECFPIHSTYSDSVHYKRKINYKVGKVSDTNLLKKFKTNETQAFKELLTYAKNSPALTEGTIDGSQKNDFNPADKIKLDERSYYFGYYTLDDENGKYYPLEDAQIYIEASGALCHFAYADMQISDEGSEDKTVSPEKLPYAGAIAISGFVIVSSIVVFCIYRKHKQYDDI